MQIGLKQLRAIQALHQLGSLSNATDVLKLTQSALSHQIKGLENQVGVDLFVRRTKPLKLAAAGMRMLKLADKILPEIEATEDEFRRLLSGKTGRLHIAIECHACFEWLFPVLEAFRKAWPDVDVDIRPGLAFEALPALVREEIDLVISSDPEQHPDLNFSPLFDYEPLFVASNQNVLAQKAWIEAEDFRDQTLITYPVDRARLDVFSQLLMPEKVVPRTVRQVELTAVILLLVASNCGVSVLPDWVLHEVRYHSDYVTRPLTETGLTRRLFAATRHDDTIKPFMAHLLKLARSQPVKM